MSRPADTWPPQREDLEAQVLKRLAVVEEAIRLQVATGATHLQQLEMTPEAYGLTAAVREPVRRLRRRRNGALHGALSARGPPPEAPRRTPPPTTTTAEVGVQTRCTQWQFREWSERNEARAMDRLLDTAFHCWAMSRPQRATTKAALDNKMAPWLARNC